jgi:copper resistance protein C
MKYLLNRELAIALAVLLALGLISTIFSGSALAHAVPETSQPPIDGTVNVAPSIVDITFSEEIVPDNSSIDVIAADGSSVIRGTSEADLTDPDRERIMVSLKSPLDPGLYTVQWTTQSAIDNDTVNGSFQFTFDPDASPTPLTPASEPIQESATPEATSREAVQSDEGGSSDSSLTLIALGGLAILSLFGLIFWRHRRRSNDANSSNIDHQ